MSLWENNMKKYAVEQWLAVHISYDKIWLRYPSIQPNSTKSWSRLFGWVQPKEKMWDWIVCNS
jgi:hypothetical protein